MKKKLVCFLLFITFLFLAIFINVSSSDNLFFHLGHDYMKVLKNNTNSDKDQINDFRLNSQLSISKQSLVEEIDLLSVSNQFDEGELAKKAVDEVIKRTVMTSYARSLGYEVSEDDFNDYKRSLIDSIEDADNYDEILNYFQGFGGIDEYFKYMEHRLKDNLLIRKYLDAEMVKYAQLKKYNIQDNEFIQIWEEKEKKIIEDQIINNNISNTDREKLVDYALDYISNKKVD